MNKLLIFILLFICFLLYSFVVYFKGTDTCLQKMNAEAIEGKLLFQKHNCTSCHQLYGLGGYLGPELTTAISNPAKGEFYCRAIIKSGTLRMPQYNLNDSEVNNLIEYLKYIDQTAVTYK